MQKNIKYEVLESVENHDRLHLDDTRYIEKIWSL